MEERDPDALADQLGAETDDLQHRGDEVGEHIQDVRQDWESKRASEAVPGANPPPSEDEEDTTQDRSGSADSQQDTD